MPEAVLQGPMKKLMVADVADDRFELDRSGVDRRMRSASWATLAARTGYTAPVPASVAPHDIVAGLVLATMLVPVGIAYAVASGLPGIYGLYATIVPLLVYALFGPSRILVLGPDSALAAVILGVVLPLSGGDPASRRDARRHDGDRFGDGMHSGRRRAPGFCYRAALQADTVRLHERNCIDRIDQPTAKALRLLDRERRTFAEPVGDRRRDP